LCALDARMGEVYWAEYRYDEAALAWVALNPPALAAPALVAPSTGGTMPTLVGNGFAAYREQFQLPEPLLAAARNTVPQADAVARLASIEFAAGRTLAAKDAQPLYLRNKVALTSAERQVAAT